MPRPHQAGGTRRHRSRQIKPHLGDPSVVKKGRSATRLRRAHQIPSPVVKEDLPPLRTLRKAPVAGAAESVSAQALQNTNVSSLEQMINTLPLAGAAGSMSVLTPEEYLDSSSEESITDSPRTVPLNTIDNFPPTLGPSILIYYPANSFEVFYIRIDRRGSFWTYPNVGGPFQSIDETENAINCFLILWKFETRISTTKGGPNSLSGENTCSEKWHLAQAILDQFNDQNNLFGNLAHELEDLLRKQIIYENHRWYYHLNFTTKQKEADDDHSTGNKLFFAEVSHMQGKKFWEVNCCCIIEFEAKGGHCFGCKNNGNPDMQHPVEAYAYTGGHLDVYLPFDFDALSSSDDDDGEYEYLYKDEDEEVEDDEFEIW